MVPYTLYGSKQDLFPGHLSVSQRQALYVDINNNAVPCAVVDLSWIAGNFSIWVQVIAVLIPARALDYGLLMAHMLFIHNVSRSETSH